MPIILTSDRLPEPLLAPTLPEILDAVDASTAPTYGICGNTYKCAIAEAVYHYNPWLKAQDLTIMVLPSVEETGALIVVSEEEELAEFPLDPALNRFGRAYDKFRWSWEPPREVVISLLRSLINIDKGVSHG